MLEGFYGSRDRHIKMNKNRKRICLSNILEWTDKDFIQLKYV